MLVWGSFWGHWVHSGYWWAQQFLFQWGLWKWHGGSNAISSLLALTASSPPHPQGTVQSRKRRAGFPSQPSQRDADQERDSSASSQKWWPCWVMGELRCKLGWLQMWVGWSQRNIVLRCVQGGSPSFVTLRPVKHRLHTSQKDGALHIRISPTTYQGPHPVGYGAHNRRRGSTTPDHWLQDDALGWKGQQRRQRNEGCFHWPTGADTQWAKNFAESTYTQKNRGRTQTTKVGFISFRDEKTGVAESWVSSRRSHG